MGRTARVVVVDRDALLELLPPCATTGIGSLPLSLDEALQLSMQQDVPYLPELAGEALVDGFSEGPTFRAFIAELTKHRPKFAKVQLAGPATLAAQGPGPVLQRLPDTVRSLVGRVAQTGAAPIIFFDEPALHESEAPVRALDFVRRAARDAGALVGLHCCGQARWEQLLALGFDFISLDARLSLDALLEDRRAWVRFLERGGRLCQGIIPTNRGARYDVNELCASVEASLRATTSHFERVLSRTLLSPACGLATHSPEDARRITSEVRLAQEGLRSVL